MSQKGIISDPQFQTFFHPCLILMYVVVHYTIYRLWREPLEEMHTNTTRWTSGRPVLWSSVSISLQSSANLSSILVRKSTNSEFPAIHIRCFMGEKRGVCVHVCGCDAEIWCFIRIVDIYTYLPPITKLMEEYIGFTGSLFLCVCCLSVHVFRFCLDDISRTTQPFVTKLDTVMYSHKKDYQEPRCLAEKLFGYLQGQGHSKGL